MTVYLILQSVFWIVIAACFFSFYSSADVKHLPLERVRTLLWGFLFAFVVAWPLVLLFHRGQ